MMRASDHRKHIPVGVKLHAVLLMLGFTEEEIAGGIDWNHNPPLALRFVDPETGEISPPANDPKHIEPMRRFDHHERTFGPGGEKRITSAGGDIHAIAHTRRAAKKEEAFRQRLLAKAGGVEPPPSKTRKRPIQSRGFGDQHRPFNNRNRSKP